MTYKKHIYIENLTVDKLLKYHYRVLENLNEDSKYNKDKNNRLKEITRNYIRDLQVIKNER